MLYWEGKERVKRRLEQVLSGDDSFRRLSVFNQGKSVSRENDWSNKLFVGDNLECMAFLLKHGFEEKFDMIYVDPPFFTETNFTVKKKF